MLADYRDIDKENKEINYVWISFYYILGNSATVALCYAEQTETFTRIKRIHNMCGGIYKPKLY